MRERTKGGTIDWLVKYIGDRCTASRSDILFDAEASEDVHKYTIAVYLTTSEYHGHVDGNVAFGRDKSRTRSYGSDRIAYFSRVRRGVYTLTPFGWRHWADLDDMPSLKWQWATDYAINQALVEVLKEDDGPDHCDYGLL